MMKLSWIWSIVLFVTRRWFEQFNAEELILNWSERGCLDVSLKVDRFDIFISKLIQSYFVGFDIRVCSLIFHTFILPDPGICQIPRFCMLPKSTAYSDPCYCQQDHCTVMEDLHSILVRLCNLFCNFRIHSC